MVDTASCSPRIRVVGIVQARMGSHRLPGKSLADLAGKPLLWRFLERVRRSSALDALVLATTTKPEDDPLVEIARALGAETFRGSENDLVDRFYQAATLHRADLVVRLCADNPVIEPCEIDRIVASHKRSDADFSANTHNILDNGYPDGLGAEVYNFSLLEQLRKTTTDPRNREHPHSWVYEHPGHYRIRTVRCPPEFSRPEIFLDVNTPAELGFLRAIYEYWYPRKANFHITDILWWYDNVCPPGLDPHVAASEGQ